MRNLRQIARPYEAFVVERQHPNDVEMLAAKESLDLVVLKSRLTSITNEIDHI
jgi:hypothetical protein